MNASHDPTAREEWITYWPLVLAATIGFSLHAVATYSIGLFMEPLAQQFDWGRAEISGGLSIAAMLAIPLSPLLGALIDRWGSRWLALSGIVLTSLTIAGFSLANGSVIQWLTLWTLYAILSLGVKATLWTAAVSGVFNAGRGVALAVVLSGTALTQILAPPICRLLIDSFGWRDAFVWLGLGWGILPFVLCLFFLYDVHDRRRLAAKAGAVATGYDLPGLTIAEAVRNLPLIRIGIATLLMMILTVGVIVHQVPILTEVGVSRETAAYLASLAGVAGIVGKLVTGVLMDRLEANRVGALTMAIAGVAFVMLLEPFRSPVLIVVAMIIIGYSSGCKLQICAYLTSRYAGMRNFGKIFGVMASLVALGAGIGPLAAGFVHDSFGSYTPLILLAIPGCLMSGLLLLGLGDYPAWK